MSNTALTNPREDLEDPSKLRIAFANHHNENVFWVHKTKSGRDAVLHGKVIDGVVDKKGHILFKVSAYGLELLVPQCKIYLSERLASLNISPRSHARHQKFSALAA